jgi:type I restriction enzyme S subunit
LREVAVPVPPREEQREIVRRVEALFKLADANDKRIATATARGEKLTQSILAKAFRGELVPTEAELARAEGRQYESATALLARLVSEQQQNNGASKQQTRRGQNVEKYAAVSGRIR